MGKCGEYQIFFVSLQRNSEKDRLKAVRSRPTTLLDRFAVRSLKKEMSMNTFIGNIEARLDAKGRVFIPASYRKILAEMGSGHIVMRRDTDNECIIFYPEHVWHAKVSQLRQALDEWDPEDQLILMQFMSEAEILDMDSQGRVLLQKKHLEMINAEQDAQFVGMLDRFALWNPEVFAAKQLPTQDLASRIRMKMKTKNQMPKT